LSITFLSYSKIDTFDQCPRAYKYKYIDYLEAEFTPDYFTLGHLVHESIARAEREKRNVIDIYKQMDVSELSEERQNEALEMLQNWQSWKNQRPDEKIIYLEESFELFTEDGIGFRGKIDRVSYYPEKKLWHIIDYKTGKSKISPKDVKSNLQLNFYAIALKLWHGDDINVQADFLYLKDLDMRGLAVTKETIKLARKKLYESYIKIAKASLFPKKPGWYCDHCQYQNFCKSDV